MTRASRAAIASLRRLARLYGVQPEYIDVARRRRQASSETLLQTLRALGAPVGSLRDVPAALRVRRHALWGRGMEPVLVAWEGIAQPELRLPGLRTRGAVGCRLTLESGEVKDWTAAFTRAAAGRAATVEGERFVVRRLSLPRRLPWGYHRLEVEVDGRRFDSMIISAPLRAWTAPRDSTARMWGVFLPLYALHSARSWGGGDFSDLEGLIEWVGALGGRVVGTLPLLAAFLDDPCEPSPYAPASRLFWNEFYVDVTRIPEWKGCVPAQALLASSAFQRELEELRAAPMVAYRRQMALKRQALALLGERLAKGPPERHAAFRRFMTEHPAAADYAAFRATGERQRVPWPSWPQPLRDGVLKEGDYDEATRRYHLYVQWVAHEQLEALAEKTRRAGVHLYLDLPLGVHPWSYDVWREREAFALGVSGGAPPDAVFTAGQNWGFPPLHPEAIRTQGYRYVIAYLRHQLQQARLIRIDHVMALHRLYWIPNGLEARKGVYVRYPAEELYAILSLESHRHQAWIVGENLGTVPAVVNTTMAGHHLQRMYVLQYELALGARRVLRAVPRESVASLNTHDMPPFAAFWEGLDVDDRFRLGLLNLTVARIERKNRRVLQHALEGSLRRQGWLRGDSPDLQALLRACLRFLSASRARVVLVNIEDLWLEREPQNVPATDEERPNWQRKTHHGFEAFREMRAVLDPLREVDDLRMGARRRPREKQKPQEYRGGETMGTQKGTQRKGAKAGASGRAVQPKARPVSFRWTVTEANSVSVVGEFNNWDPQAHPLRKDKEGVWKATVRLKPGRYEYMFIVDGQWREDPSNPDRVPNPHGGFNSVCHVR